MDGAKFMFLLIIAMSSIVLALTAITRISTGAFSASTVRRACVGHSGVRQVEDLTWSASDDSLIVVCMDGTVVGHER